LVGIFHPMEIWYLAYGVVYYLTIPCMYLLLPIFCVFNLDDVSWGTRDPQSGRKDKEGNPLLNILHQVLTAGPEVERLEASLVNQLKRLERKEEKEEKEGSDTVDAADNKANEDMLGIEETELWNQVIQKFLIPRVKTSQEKQEIKEGLQSLKTEIFLLFLFLNAAWAFGIFQMQLSSLRSSAFSIDWRLCDITPSPSLAHLNGTIIQPPTEYTKLDPINFVFIVFFLVVLFLQVFGMLVHRVTTIGHIVATTDIFYTGRLPMLREQFHELDINMVDGRPQTAFSNPLHEQLQPE